MGTAEKSLKKEQRRKNKFLRRLAKEGHLLAQHKWQGWRGISRSGRLAGRQNSTGVGHFIHKSWKKQWLWPSSTCREQFLLSWESSTLGRGWWQAGQPAPPACLAWEEPWHHIRGKRKREGMVDWGHIQTWGKATFPSLSVVHLGTFSQPIYTTIWSHWCDPFE